MQLLHARQELCACKEVADMAKVVLKCAKMEFGELYVMITGIHKMLRWSASSWDSPPLD